MSTSTLAAFKAKHLLNNYINNSSNIILDDELNSWERHTNNLNFLSNLCKGEVSSEEVERFFDTGILPLLLDESDLEHSKDNLVSIQIFSQNEKQYYINCRQKNWL